MFHGTVVSSGSRVTLAGATAILAVLFSGMAATQARAFDSFCVGALLEPGASCESPSFTMVLEVLAEVTGTNSGEICVAINEPGGVRVGKRCATNFVQSQEGIGTLEGKAWVHNNSSNMVTVTGAFLL